MDGFKVQLVADLAIEMRVTQELNDLVRTLGGNKLLLRAPCMKGTRIAILQRIEDEINKVGDHNVIWIRGSPGVGKSALAASISTQLTDQGRRVISFRFDRTESTRINTEALWRIVACDLARWYPSLRQHLAKGIEGHVSLDIDRLFKLLIEMPLSTLDHDIPHEQLPVIVVDALDECGGLRYDSTGRKDYEALLHTLQRYTQEDHLKKFKLIITSRPDDRITRTFPDSISTHVNIPSGKDVKPGDSASNDIHAFLKKRFEVTNMGDAWVNEALDYLVPRSAGMFIWATTVADFLQENPERRFHILKRREQEPGAGRFEELNSLYSTVIRTSFHDLEEEEIKAITSVVGATIFAKQPLDDTALMRLPGVEDPHTLKFIKNGLISVIDSGSTLRFHHRSFEDSLLHPSFSQCLGELSAIQDRDLHERQLAALCLNSMISSELHFNICNLESSNIRNVDIPATAKSAISPLVSYSSLFWADHLVQTQCKEILVEAVKFIMYEKLLFWIEVMSILGKAHEVSAILKRALEWPGLAVCLEYISYTTTLRLARQILDPKNELTSFIRDALRFISAFIIPISQSAPQIYLSALPFTPERSLVGKKFRPRFPNTLTISDGRPSQWLKNIFVAEHHKHSVECIVLSPDEKTFVSTSLSLPSPYTCIITSYVCDSETGHCISGPFEFEESGNSFLSGTGVLDTCFNPDGKHILVRSRKTPSHHAVVWEIEKGEKVSQIKGSDFVFIHCGRNKGRIASVDWIDGDGSSFCVLVKLWDIGNDISDRLFEVTGVAVTRFQGIPIARFSPDGQYLAVGRRSENVVELWNLEDGKSTHRFPYPTGYIRSLHFSPTSDCLMPALNGPGHPCLWRLDTQEMTSFDIGFDEIPPAIIHSPNANRLFLPRYNAVVEIWEVSMISSDIIFMIEHLTTSSIKSICPSRDGQRLLVGSYDGTIRMRDMEDLGGSQPIIQGVTDEPRIIKFSPSGKMVATGSHRSGYVELQDTTTWELVGPRDVEYERGIEIAFPADDKQIAVFDRNRVTICDIMHPENRLSFDPWPKGRHVYYWKAAFQTCNNLVICARLRGDRNEISGLLQVWKLKDHSKCMSSLDINMNINAIWPIFLAPDGLTVIFTDPVLCYSWNHETAQFDRIHFTDEAHLYRGYGAYSPDVKLFPCHSRKDNDVRVWDTRTGQLCRKHITMPDVDGIALSPALNDPSLGDRLIAIHYSNTVKLFDVYTCMLSAGTQDGAWHLLEMEQSWRPIVTIIQSESTI